jgi:hypothetical protein
MHFTTQIRDLISVHHLIIDVHFSTLCGRDLKAKASSYTGTTFARIKPNE